MGKFDKRTQANMNVVLEDVCRDLSKRGGDHESRKYIAEQLIEAASAGKTTLGDLEPIARASVAGSGSDEPEIGPSNVGARNPRICDRQFCKLAGGSDVIAAPTVEAQMNPSCQQSIPLLGRLPPWRAAPRPKTGDFLGTQHQRLLDRLAGRNNVLNRFLAPERHPHRKSATRTSLG